MSSNTGFPQLMSQLCTEDFILYLIAQGWTQMDCEYENRLCFESEVHDDGEPYRLYLPAARSVAKYRTLLQRAIYFLTEVEDREPAEIAQDILACECEAPAPPSRSGLRVRNSATQPLQLRITTGGGTRLLLPGEAFEFARVEVVEIEHRGQTLTIHARQKSED